MNNIMEETNIKDYYDRKAAFLRGKAVVSEGKSMRRDNKEIYWFRRDWLNKKSLRFQQWLTLREEGENLILEQYWKDTQDWLDSELGINDDVLEWMENKGLCTIREEFDGNGDEELIQFDVTPEVLERYKQDYEIWLRDKTILFLPGFSVVGC